MNDETLAEVLAGECFRHSWDMSDERLIDGAWVGGLCCECGDFVPYGQEVAHIADALAPLLAAVRDQATKEAGAKALEDAASEISGVKHGLGIPVAAWLKTRAYDLRAALPADQPVEEPWVWHPDGPEAHAMLEQIRDEER